MIILVYSIQLSSRHLSLKRVNCYENISVDVPSIAVGSDTSLILNHHQLPMLQSFFCRNVRFYRCTLGIKWSAAKSQKPEVFLTRAQVLKNSLSIILWIVATWRTKRFQLTDNVFRIDHVNIGTMNILESDIARK